MTVLAYDKDITRNVLRPTILKLEQQGNGVALQAVDRHGDCIATIAVFGPTCSQKLERVQTTLRAAGYDTGFANWDSDGRIVLNWHCDEEQSHYNDRSK